MVYDGFGSADAGEQRAQRAAVDAVVELLVADPAVAHAFVVVLSDSESGVVEHMAFCVFTAAAVGLRDRAAHEFCARKVCGAMVAAREGCGVARITVESVETVFDPEGAALPLRVMLTFRIDDAGELVMFDAEDLAGSGGAAPRRVTPPCA